MDKIAVLIPCYNESATIEKVINDWKKELPEAVIYVYDNNSTDNTDKIAREAGAVVRYERQQGKGIVVRRMFREIDAECYIMIDGDDTYPAEYGREMIEKVLNNDTDMVVGDRLSSTYFTENKRPFHNFGNSIVRLFINKIFKSNIKDIMTGYRAFSYQFVKSFPVLSKGFEIETEMSIHAVDKKMQIENVIIQYRDRPEGSVSKLSTYTDGLKVIRTIFRLFRDYKPLQFFGIISLILFLISMIMFIPVLLEFYKTGLVSKFPTLIVSGFVALSALLSFFSGLILETIIRKDKQLFEFKMQTARYIKEYPEELSKYDVKVITQILNCNNDISKIGDYYKPELADNVKNKYNKYSTNEDLFRYFKVWGKGLLKHPGVYIETYLNLHYGWFSFEGSDYDTYSTVAKTRIEEVIPFENSTGNPSTREVVKKGMDLIKKSPITAIFVELSTYTWLYLFLLLYALKHKQKNSLAVILLPIINYLIYFIGPIAYMRYAMPMVCTAPFYIFITFKNNE